MNVLFFVPRAIGSYIDEIRMAKTIWCKRTAMYWQNSHSSCYDQLFLHPPSRRWKGGTTASYEVQQEAGPFWNPYCTLVRAAAYQLGLRRPCPAPTGLLPSQEPQIRCLNVCFTDPKLIDCTIEILLGSISHFIDNSYCSRCYSCIYNWNCC